MKDEHIYSPSFKKQVLEKLKSLKEDLKLPTKKVKVVQSTEPLPKPDPIKPLPVTPSEKPVFTYKQTSKPIMKAAISQPTKVPIKTRQESIKKTTKSRKFKITREVEEKILVFTLLFSIVSIILLGILISYFNLF